MHLARIDPEAFDGILREFREDGLAAWRTVPWYALSTGALGLVIGGSIGYGTARLGLVTPFLL